MKMPMPDSGESMQNFMSRCMSDAEMMDEFPDDDARAAACSIQSGKSNAAGIFRKSFTGLELKKDKPGAFTARIATLNVIDKDGDVTLAGAFPNGKTILISAYMHGSWTGALPVGKGVIREKGEDVFVDGEFNLNSVAGKEHYETVKFTPEITEWSYGFHVKELDEESEWSKNPAVWRVLKTLDVFEASPVLLGAGVNTTTLDIKSEKNQGKTLTEQAEAVLAAVKALGERTRSLADLRKKEGRDLSTATREKIAELRKAVGAISAEIDALDAGMPESDALKEGKTELLKLLRTQSNIFGGINEK